MSSHSEMDTKLSKDLLATLESLTPSEDKMTLKRRQNALRELEQLISEWVVQLNAEKNGAEAVSCSGGRLLTCGSYRLGVQDRGSDIDCLCVVPRFVTREDFFDSFFEILRASTRAADVNRIPEAFVPVIKLKFRGFEIDLLFAQVDLLDLPSGAELEERLMDDALIFNLDMKSVRSLNSLRTSCEIRRLLPNEENFRVTLKAVKLWAKRHSIYSNALGFLGGISWTILVARVCQMHPEASPPRLLDAVFRLMTTWKWPEPILLKEASTTSKCRRLDKFVWNPQANQRDQMHLMPIVTPAYPEQNSAVNVSIFHLKVMLRESFEALEMTKEIVERKAPWSRLFEEVNFFSRYKYFVMIGCTAKTREEHNAFSSLVEAKIRVLMGALMESEQFLLAHVSPQKFDPLRKSWNRFSKNWFIGLEPLRGKKDVSIGDQLLYFNNEVFFWAQKMPCFNQLMALNFEFIPARDLGRLTSAEELKKGRPATRKRKYRGETAISKRHHMEVCA